MWRKLQSQENIWEGILYPEVLTKKILKALDA